MFKSTRISAMRALQFYIDRYGIKSIPIIDKIIKRLKSIIQEKDQDIKKSAIGTLNSIIKHQLNGSIEGLEDQISETPDLIDSFYHAALKGQYFSQKACITIAKLLSPKQNIHR